MVATCSWCGNGFGKVDQIYWCKTPACRQRQLDHATIITQRGTQHLFDVPLPRQIEMTTSASPMLLGGGAAMVSKSHGARRALIRRALLIPGFEALILRTTWDELKKHHLRLLEAEALQLRGYGVDATYSRTDREFCIHHPSGPNSVIEGGHMEEDKDVYKYLSRERDAIVPDEASRFQPDHLLELSTRARSTKPRVAAFARQMHGIPDDVDVPRGGANFWAFTNPGGPASPMLRDFFIDHTPDPMDYPQLYELDSDGQQNYNPSEWGYVPGQLEDNPYAPKSYERDLTVLSPWRYQQLRFNNWDVIAGQFFTEFDSRTHVKDLGQLGPGVEWFRSYDYGFQHKSFCLWWACLPDGRLYIRRELVQQHTDIPTICQAMRDVDRELHVPRIRYTVADRYSMGSLNKDKTGETRRERFMYCGVPVTSADHDHQQGWTACRELLALRQDGLPWVVFHPDCRQLIREIASAVSADNEPEEVSPKSDDDGLDAWRYGAMSPMARGVLRTRALPLPKHAVGHLLQQVRHQTGTDPYKFV